jgi:hypothetical protein
VETDYRAGPPIRQNWNDCYYQAEIRLLVVTRGQASGYQQCTVCVRSVAYAIISKCPQRSSSLTISKLWCFGFMGEAQFVYLAQSARLGRL